MSYYNLAQFYTIYSIYTISLWPSDNFHSIFFQFQFLHFLIQKMSGFEISKITKIT